MTSLASFAEFQVLTEGAFDPGILKCVFMAGGAGSGKSHVAADLFDIDKKVRSSFSSFGLKLVNSDPEFERLLHKMGVNPGDLAKIEAEDPERFYALTGAPDSPRERAKTITKTRHALYMQGRLGLIVDGTGANVQKMAFKKHEAEGMGYDTMMIFVNTSLETSLKRNQMRARRMPDHLVQELWNEVQKNIDAFGHVFGHNFVVVNNDETAPAETLALVRQYVGQFIRMPIQNPLGRAWMAAAQGQLAHLAPSR